MRNKVTIGSLNTDDITALRELFKNSGPYVTQRGTSDYWLYTRLFSNTCLGAKDGENLIGALLSFCDQTKSNTELYIQDIAVSPQNQGHGVGESLLKEIIHRTKFVGITKIWLTSEAENDKAIQLWLKYGFENKKADYIKDDLWVTRDLKGPGRDRIVYSLDLND
ncbi:MAG: GNAT family N-acetyltransferase [Clostridiales bacterium]